MTKFYDYRMSIGDSVAQHIAKIENMARQLKDLGEVVSDVTIMAKILGSLPSKYNALVTAWDSVDADKQTLENLAARLIKEENRMTAIEAANALTAASTSKPQKNQYGKTIGVDKKTVECFYCYKKGHMSRYCRKKQRDLSRQSKQPTTLANVSAFLAEATISIKFNQEDSKNMWILDSGASKHMSFREEWLQDLSQKDGEYVSLGDGTVCEVKRHGTINIKRFVEGKWLDDKLEDVLFVPTLNKNLFSVGTSRTCVKKNYNIFFEGISVTIISNGVNKAHGIKQDNNLYKMLFKVMPNKACTAVTYSLHLWHALAT